MARKQAPIVEDIDLDEEDLEDLDAEFDEEEAEEDEEETPAPKRKAKSPTKKKTKVKTTVGAGDVAAALETTGRSLRMLLRAKGLNETAKNENNRYEWPTLEDALESMGFDDVDEAKAAIKEQASEALQKMKDRLGPKKGKKKTKARGRPKKAPEPDEDDEDEEEDEE